MKKLCMMILAMTFCLAKLADSETITKIVGSKITVKDDVGIENTIESAAQGLKVGDKVTLTVKDGRTWLNPQPEPPKPVKVNPTELKGSALQTKGAYATPEAPPPPPPPKGGQKMK
jgi:hypothetical protein